MGPYTELIGPLRTLAGVKSYQAASQGPGRYGVCELRYMVPANASPKQLTCAGGCASWTGYSGTSSRWAWWAWWSSIWAPDQHGMTGMMMLVHGCTTCTTDNRLPEPKVNAWFETYLCTRENGILGVVPYSEGLGQGPGQATMRLPTYLGR